MKAKPGLPSLLCLGLVCLGAVGLESGAAHASPALDRLVQAARQEGRLDFMVISMGGPGEAELVGAFKKRFNLDIRLNFDASGQESQKFNQAVAETKAGIPPTFDLMQGEPPVVQDLLRADGIEAIENWEPLLKEIAPEAHAVKDQLSPTGLAGYGFLWATRITTLMYNPRVVREADLPKNWKALGDPKHRGAFSVPPWTTITLMGLLKYDKTEWLETVKSWGRLKPRVLHYAAAVERMIIGDLKFLETNTHYYFKEKSSDPNAPIEMRFFDDFTPMRQVLYVVRKGARHPNAAKLFALWATSAEANRIFERHAIVENLALGTGPITQKSAERLNKQQLKPVSWFDTPQNLEKFLWLGTKEGQDYSRAIARAQREGM